MIRIPRSRAWLLLTTPWFLGGCGGTGTEKAAPGPTTSANAPAAATDQVGGVPAKAVTPNRSVDTKSVVDVVKGEVKGGEATEGPTPANYLWLYPDSTKIQDEPLTITVPKGLNDVFAPASNPLTRAKVELGRQLYFDPRVSKDATISCATCHNPERGWTDQMPSSIGIKGQVGSRSAPTVLNSAFGRVMFWDGRAPSLEGQAQGPIQNKIEMGDQSYQEIVERLRTIAGYREQFQKVFGTDVTLDGMAKAIASFERTILTGNSPYDKYLDQDDSNHNSALNESQKRGLVLFGLRLNDDDPFNTPEIQKTLKKADCTSCHIGANFTDDQYHNLGVGWDDKTGKFADVGRFGVAPIGSKDPKELGAFKTPMLRDLDRTAPYMHDGSEKTLEDVIAFYDRGGNPNPALDKDIKKLGLTDPEKKDLIAFLKALNGEETRVELPTLPSGPDGKAPDPRAALTPPTPSAVGRVDAHGVFVR